MISIPKTPYSCVVLADTLHPSGRHRLTTLCVRMPRFILAEFNTHRVFSRNSASSRAIPARRRIQEVRLDPFIPETFGANQSGMQAGPPLDVEAQNQARDCWRAAAIAACAYARQLDHLGTHKEHVNRLIEPFSWTTVIVTATEWENFFALRLSKAAQPEMQRVAQAMRLAMEQSTPLLPSGASVWAHVPLVTPDEQQGPSPPGEEVKLSVARCARVSYLTHDGRRDPAEDLALHDRLLQDGHMSPFEHQAQVGEEGTAYANFMGFRQYRSLLPGGKG